VFGYGRCLRRGITLGKLHKLTICKPSSVLKGNILAQLTMVGARNALSKD
jgi:hypothetical protein